MYVGLSSRLSQIFLILPIKYSESSFAIASGSLYSAKVLLPFLPVRQLSNPYSFFVSLPHSSVFSLMHFVLISLNVTLYLLLSLVGGTPLVLLSVLVQDFLSPSYFFLLLSQVF